MNDEMFLSTIHAEPDDDMHRLAYADWLEERGDPRGEFIHVQCWLARMEDDDARLVPFQRRERELLDAHGEAWLGELRTLAKRGTFHRGFLDEVTVEPRVLLSRQTLPCPPTVRRVLVDLDDYQVDVSIVELMPESVARENELFLFGVRERVHYLAMANPEDLGTIQKVQFILNREVAPVAARWEQILDAIERHYGDTETETVDSILVDFTYADAWPDSPPTPTQRVNELIAEAVNRRARRVVCEPEEYDVGTQLGAEPGPRYDYADYWGMVARLRQMAALSARHRLRYWQTPAERGTFRMPLNRSRIRVHLTIEPSLWASRMLLEIDAQV